MKQIMVGDPAPDFSLPDYNGRLYTLSEIITRKNALLVFNIGFAWPHCTNHMAQLRHDYEKFCSLNTEILVMVPNGPFMIRSYVNLTSNPYPILSDKGSRVAGQFFQVKHLIKLGTPTVFLVDRQGIIRYAHYATSLLEEPSSQEPMAILADMGSK